MSHITRKKYPTFPRDTVRLILNQLFTMVLAFLPSLTETTI